MEGEPVTGETMTPQEVARKLHVSPKTVIRWIISGELIGFQFGRLYRVTRRMFEKFLCEHMIRKEKD